MQPPKPLTEQEVEAAKQLLGLDYPSLTPAKIDGLIQRHEFYRVPGTTYISCYIHLTNGHIVHGAARPVSDGNFIESVGESTAYKNAREQIWELAGYELRQRITDARGGLPKFNPTCAPTTDVGVM